MKKDLCKLKLLNNQYYDELIVVYSYIVGTVKKIVELHDWKTIWFNLASRFVHICAKLVNMSVVRFL